MGKALQYLHLSNPLDVGEIEKAVNRAVNILEIDKKTLSLEPVNDTFATPLGHHWQK